MLGDTAIFALEPANANPYSGKGKLVSQKKEPVMTDVRVLGKLCFFLLDISFKKYAKLLEFQKVTNFKGKSLHGNIERKENSKGKTQWFRGYKAS